MLFDAFWGRQFHLMLPANIHEHAYKFILSMVGSTSATAYMTHLRSGNRCSRSGFQLRAAFWTRVSTESTSQSRSSAACASSTCTARCLSWWSIRSHFFLTDVS